MTAEALARIDADLARRVEAYLDSSVTAPTSRALITDVLAALIPEPLTGNEREGLDLEALAAKARAQMAAIDQMDEVGIGVGGMTRPNLVSHLAWQDATAGYDHADTVLALIERLQALIHEPPTVASVEEWSAAMDAERQRQIEHGYDDAHDREHGPVHILNWAIDYARRGRVLEAATMVRSALHVLTPSPPTGDEREALRNAVAPHVYDGSGGGVGDEEFTKVVDEIVTAVTASAPWRNRHRGPITDEMVESGARALFEESQELDQDNSWDDSLPDDWREAWKYQARCVLEAARDAEARR